MKVTVEVITVENGQLKRIHYDDVTYEVTPTIYKALFLEPLPQPEVRPTPIPQSVISHPKPRKYHRGKPKGAVGKDRTYNTWVLESEVTKVKQAILHVANGYVPTTPAIVKQTGLQERRVQATLHYLKMKGQIRVQYRRGLRINRLVE